MAPHFKTKLTINTNAQTLIPGGLLPGGLSLGGPLELDKGDKVVKLDVWVWQEKCVCVADQDPPPSQGATEWEINTNPRVHHLGDFGAGPATAMALLVTENAKGVYETYQWTQGILLEEPPPASSSNSAQVVTAPSKTMEPATSG